jgi:hypothetical protein
MVRNIGSWVLTIYLYLQSPHCFNREMRNQINLHPQMSSHSETVTRNTSQVTCVKEVTRWSVLTFEQARSCQWIVIEIGREREIQWKRKSGIWRTGGEIMTNQVKWPAIKAGPIANYIVTDIKITQSVNASSRQTLVMKKAQREIILDLTAWT